MLPPRGTKKRIFLLLFLVVVMLMFLKNTQIKNVQAPVLESALRDIFAPCQRTCIEITKWVKNVLSFPVTLIHVAERNRELNEEVVQLKGVKRQLEEYRLENERLKKLLDFESTVVSESYSSFIAAAVIGRDPDNWFSAITLNKGLKQGVEVNMVVLMPEGLVGRVIRVSNNTAQVLLVTDPRSAVSGLIQETRSPGLVEGTADPLGKLRMVHIPYDVFLKKGQTVITSGMGSLFPKGVPIGEIVETKKDPSGMFYNATVRPYVDFHRLEEVLIIRQER